MGPWLQVLNYHRPKITISVGSVGAKENVMEKLCNTFLKSEKTAAAASRPRLSRAII